MDIDKLLETTSEMADDKIDKLMMHIEIDDLLEETSDLD